MALRLSTGLRNQLLGLASSELVNNGTFDSAITGWTGDTITTPAYVAGPEDGRSNVASVGTAAGYMYQQVTVKAGHFYKLSYYYDGTNNAGSNGYPRVSVGTAAGNRSLYDSGAAGLTATSWTQVTTYFYAGSTATSVFINLEATGTGTQYFDSVSLTEVGVGRSLKEIFTYGELRIYDGSQPTSADDDVSGTLLVTIKNGTDGITWEDAASGSLAKKISETWSGVGAATGTARYFRLVQPGDAGGSSSTLPRIDGGIATTGSQLNFTSTAFAKDATQTISTFTITVPAS